MYKSQLNDILDLKTEQGERHWGAKSSKVNSLFMLSFQVGGEDISCSEVFYYNVQSEQV